MIHFLSAFERESFPSKKLPFPLQRLVWNIRVWLMSVRIERGGLLKIPNSLFLLPSSLFDCDYAVHSAADKKHSLGKVQSYSLVWTFQTWLAGSLQCKACCYIFFKYFVVCLLALLWYIFDTYLIHIFLRKGFEDFYQISTFKIEWPFKSILGNKLPDLYYLSTQSQKIFLPIKAPACSNNNNYD